MVEKIDSKKFEEVKNNGNIVIDFSATWCGPCMMLAPVMEEVSEELKNTASFYNIDVDENNALAMSFGISSIPAIVVMKNGEPVGATIGFQGKEELKSFITSKL